jgi:hypothetical protein
MAQKAKTARKKSKRTQQSWTRQMVVELRKHSRARTPITVLEKAFNRTAGALRQKARQLGFSLGHRRRKKRA